MLGLEGGSQEVSGTLAGEAVRGVAMASLSAVIDTSSPRPAAESGSAWGVWRLTQTVTDPAGVR
jgi:hypothetical protein